uniref:PROTEASOME_ALPHA_1 domain-containing protein n=1 Tax=Gongylonema pulchrum TaxID=637853 RepID=A0A183EWQ9_9BILA
LAPLLRLFTLPPILTLPPPPTIDSYGINTIPELPPQHESIYAGMFAPDGSLIKKNTSTVKQTETNLIYDQETGQTGRERGARAAIIRALDERIADEDDHNLFDVSTSLYMGTVSDRAVITSFIVPDCMSML